MTFLNLSFNFIQKNLLANKRIVYSTKLNCILYIEPFVIIFIVIVLFTGSLHGISRFILYRFGIIFFITRVFSALLTYFKIKSFEFAVTNKRVLIKHGILRTQSFAIMLNKVEAVYVEQNIIIGRIVNSGKIIIKDMEVLKIH